jgi:hypothetical protein
MGDGLNAAAGGRDLVSAGPEVLQAQGAAGAMVVYDHDPTAVTWLKILQGRHAAVIPPWM